MSCFQNGELVGGGGGGGPLNVLTNFAEGVYSTTSGAFPTVTGSGISIPAGDWVFTWSIELSVSASGTVAIARVRNTTDAVSYQGPVSIMINTAGEYELCGGDYYTTFGGTKNLEWQLARLSGAGTVYCQRARIVAIEKA